MNLHKNAPAPTLKDKKSTLCIRQSTQLRPSLIQPFQTLHGIRSLPILLYSHPILLTNIKPSSITLLHKS